jgi:hypothetical protein
MERTEYISSSLGVFMSYLEDFQEKIDFRILGFEKYWKYSKF